MEPSMIQDPIIVVGMARSGTSLAAGMLAVQGVWVGTSLHEPRYLNPHGDLVNKKLSWIYTSGITQVSVFKKKIVSEIYSQGYSGGPWLVKHKVRADLCGLWKRAFNNPFFVTVRRDIASIYQSRNNMCLYKGGKPFDVSFDQFKANAEIHIETMEQLKKQGAIEIWPDRIMNGDYSAITDICNQFGIDFDEEKAKGFLVPECWRFHG